MKRLYIYFLTFIIIAAANGQDIHFSQFYNAPLLLNPALTGFTSGTYRISLNYRNQWFTATSGGFGKTPYMTSAAGVDVPIPIKGDALGVGLLFVNDQAGANAFSTFMACASVSYIKTLGKKQRNRLSAGFQAGYTYQSIQNLEFASQFEDNIYSSALPTNENIGITHVGYLNLNTGLFWYGKLSEYFAMYAGGSFFNITTPKYDIITGQDHDLYWRWNMHTGLDVTLNKKYHILPSMMYMSQGPDNQFNLGLGFGGDFEADMKLTLGVYSRFNTLDVGTNPDAMIPYLAVDFKGFKLGMTYDCTISQLKNSGTAVGALEFSLSYTGKGKRYSGRKELVAPRF